MRTILALFRRIKKKLLPQSGPRYVGLYLSPGAEFQGQGLLKYGQRCSIADHCRIVLTGSLELGSDIHILAGSEFDAHDIRIGNQTSIQKNSTILGRVDIGAYNVFGPNLYISSGAHQFRRNPPLNIRDQDEQLLASGDKGRPVRIGEDCWFGINVVVLAGVTIGKGCVVGANSVVTKNIAPYSVVAGTPAKILSTRLDFSPPKTIVVCDEHIPYFYQGFKTRLNERTADFMALSARDFTVALDLRGASEVAFLVQGASGLQFGSTFHSVVDGIIRIRLNDPIVSNHFVTLSCLEKEWRQVRIGKIWAE